MEYYLCRAMEVCRLSEDQLYWLHNHEIKSRLIQEIDPITLEPTKFKGRDKRCLFPWEIQECFDLPTLKEVYGIPDNDVAQSGHNQRLRGMFRKKGLIPIGGDLVITDVETIHAFDEKVRLDPELDLQFRYTGEGKKGRKKAVDEIDDDQKSKPFGDYL